jgi:hypothetical protein
VVGVVEDVEHQPVRGDAPHKRALAGLAGAGEQEDTCVAQRFADSILDETGEHRGRTSARIRWRSRLDWVSTVQLKVDKRPFESATH